jgi:hypothetical protein
MLAYLESERERVAEGLLHVVHGAIALLYSREEVRVVYRSTVQIRAAVLCVGSKCSKPWRECQIAVRICMEISPPLPIVALGAYYV